jgi:23S rRNA maturation mini-RNase III
MSTQTGTSTGGIKSFPLAWVLAALVLLVALVAVSALPLLAPHAAAAGVDGGILRGRAADATRYNAMATYFAAESGSWAGQTQGVGGLRLKSIVEHLSATEAANLERGRAAESARLNAAAQSGTWAAQAQGVGGLRLKSIVEHLSATEAADLERGRAAESARLNAMANYFAQMK